MSRPPRVISPERSLERHGDAVLQRDRQVSARRPLHLLESDDPNGVQLATYENRVVTGRGDEYNELYAGANYYFYGHKLKLQSGVQVADMNDRANDGGAYSGVSWTTGIRVGW